MKLFQSKMQGKLNRLFQYFIFPFIRWCVFDLEWEAEDGRKVSKVCLIAFAPDDCVSNQEKFLVAANKGALN
jgi:hypothetical protein